MLQLPSSTVYQKSNCFFTATRVSHVNPSQPPSKGKPWTTIDRLDFIHKIDLILPQECFKLVNQKLLSQPPLEYKRVIMTLQDMFEGDFMQEYIKIGNIMMLSEGRLGQDNVFMLTDGNLTLFLDKETYERAGLTGRVHGAKGGRGFKSRYIVEIDLREDSMWPGKKGFDRILYACQNVLTAKLTWLFCNPGKVPATDPLAKHFPTSFTCRPTTVQPLTTIVPAFIIEKDDVRDSLIEKDEFITDFYEWLSLIRLQSPRAKPTDDIDPYLSRYRLPDSENDNPTDLCMISWQGFISPKQAKRILVDVISTVPSKQWFALSMTTLLGSKNIAGDEKDTVVVTPPALDKQGRKCYLWEVKSHE